MIENRPDKRQATSVLADEINDMILQLNKAENILDDVATKYFGKSPAPEGWALANEYQRFSTKVEIVADYLWNLREMLSCLEVASEERSVNNG